VAPLAPLAQGALEPDLCPRANSSVTIRLPMPMTPTAPAESVDGEQAAIAARGGLGTSSRNGREGIVDNPDLALSLTDAGGAITANPTFEGALETVACLAPTVVPHIDHVGVMLTGRRGRIRGVVATDALARDLDQLQIEQRHGPGLWAMEQTRVVIVERVQHEQRWPEFTVIAAERGVRSQLALRLDVDAKTHGALNLYCTSRESVAQETVRAAWLYGIHAGWALRHARLRQHLDAVLDSRELIGQACGLVMQRFRVDHGQALSFIVRVSQSRNVKMRELARDLVEHAEKEYLAALQDTDTGLHVTQGGDTSTAQTQR
jgi:hypothetical protein